MKTEKKPNEPNCISNTVVKEEPDGDTVKIKEETPGGNHEDTTGEDTNECTRDPTLDSTNGETTMSTDTSQNGTGNQSMLGLVKQENDHNNPNDDMSSDGIQPLVSNVLGKPMAGGAGSEAQYMQQQSQIFVFSTTLANKGADAVLQGQFPSIIAYHCAQPGTKKYLEKHPNKVNQFRQNPAQWLNNLAMMKQKGHQPTPPSGYTTEQPPDLPVLDPNAPSFWNEQSNIRNLNGSNSLGNPETSLDDTNIDVPCLVPNSPGNPANNQNPTNTTIGPNSNLLSGTTSPGPGGGLQPSLQGVKVPDENLTPQQRQHRELQLATIRKMQMMLFPEHKDDPNSTLDPTQPGAPVATGVPTGNLPPVSTSSNQCATNMDWHKLQHQFLDSKNKVGIGSPGSVSLRGSSMLGGLPRSQGPPPPYHQTTRSASVPIATQSPNPSSPNNPTSNLSLPSPRANSALNSPADCNRQFQLNSQRPGYLPGQSPTSQDSPNAGSTSAASTTRLNHSNPGTPVSHSHLASLSPSNTTPQKEQSLDFPSNQPSNVDGMFCRTLQNLVQQKQQLSGTVNAAGVKEANLMPVPSPQQIQYLNTFEGQELTIQKQPNTSLKDGSLQNNNNNNNSNTNNNNNNSNNNNNINSNSNNTNNGSSSSSSSNNSNNSNSSNNGNNNNNNNNNSNNNNSGNNGGNSNNNSVTANTDVSGRIMPSNIDSSNQYPARSEGSSPSIESMNRGFGASLHSPHTPHTPHTPGNPSGAPQTPVDVKQSNKTSTSAQSSPVPLNPLTTDSMGPPRTVPASPNTKPETFSPSSKDLSQPPTQTTQQPPQAPQVQPQPQLPPQQQPPQQLQPQQTPQSTQPMQPAQSQQPALNQNNGPPNNIVPPMTGPMNTFSCSRSQVNVSQSSENVPLNPNNLVGGRLGGITSMNASHFDPITSLAQMSQQLTNTAAANNTLGNDSPMHPGNTGMMPFNNPHGMHMMQMGPNEMNGGCHMGGGLNETNEVGGMCMSLGGPPASYSPTTSHTGSPVGSNKIGHPMMGHGMMGGHNGPPTGYPVNDQHVPPPRLMGQHIGQGPSPYNGANIQVKPSAPNTIQYLPARPNVGHAPRGPPSLDFLQRFTNPLTNLDSKMQSPSVNLQYFPNGCLPNNIGGPHSGMPGNMGGQGGLGGMAGGGGPRMDAQPMNTGIHPSMRPSVGNLRPQPNIMRMQHMVGGGVFPGSPMDPDKVFPPDMAPSQVPNQQNPGMYVPGSKASPMGLGPPPDASQPLPPSMGGATGNFKNSPFVGGGPSMADPNYAQQFHNFQQQLYATGTRGSGPPHPNLHPPPNSHAHQQFFMPK